MKEGPQLQGEIDWPTDEGIWVGMVGGGVGWFPFQTKFLLGDLEGDPSFGKPIALVAQWLESKTSWPFLFKGSHPVGRWRRPTDDELKRAMVLYGLKAKPQPPPGTFIITSGDVRQGDWFYIESLGAWGLVPESGWGEPIKTALIARGY